MEKSWGALDECIGFMGMFSIDEGLMFHSLNSSGFFFAVKKSPVSNLETLSSLDLALKATRHCLLGL